MSSTYDTEDWALAAFVDWKPKKEGHSTPCEYCGGSGEVGGGFKSLDGPEPCPKCFGSGGHWHPGVTTEKPPVPDELVEHMRAAWQAFFADKK